MIRSTPESGSRAGYDGHKRRNGSKVHIAVDTLGHLPGLVTPADAQERELAVQEATGASPAFGGVLARRTTPQPAPSA